MLSLFIIGSIAAFFGLSVGDDEYCGLSGSRGSA